MSGDVWGTPATSRPSTDAEQRARARERVNAAVRQGKQPSVEYSLEQLRWAFGDLPEVLVGNVTIDDLLAELDKRAIAIHETARERERRVQSANALRHLTDRIEDEMLAAEQRERRAKAEAEARRRLGVEAGD